MREASKRAREHDAAVLGAELYGRLCADGRPELAQAVVERLAVGGALGDPLTS